MLNRLVLLFAIIIVLVPGAASARRYRRPALPQDLPTLFVSKDVMAIRNGRQKLTVNLTDASLSLQTPQGSHALKVSIASPSGSVQPTGVLAAPKTYRAKDLVTAVVTLAVPDDRKMVLRISAYPGVGAVFVKSSVTGQGGGLRDSYFWSLVTTIGESSPSVTSGRKDWAFLSTSSGGLAVLTNGVMEGQSELRIHPLPSWRLLGPRETLDVGFGLAGVTCEADAAALSKLARDRHVATLKPVYLTKQTKINYGAPAPDWLRHPDVWCVRADAVPDGQSVILTRKADKALIAKAHEAGARVVVCVNYARLTSTNTRANPANLLDIASHPAWACIAPDGSERSEDGTFTCFHQADLRQNALTDVLNILNVGADGILLEDAGLCFECYAPKYGKHTHQDPYDTNTAAAEELQKQIYKLVKSFGEDKAVIHQSNILPSHWAYCDAQICNLTGSLGEADGACTLWPDLQYLAEEHAEAVRHGKAAMVSLDSRDGKDAPLFIQAYARICDLRAVCDGDGGPITLGKPLGSLQRSDGVLYRSFENGGGRPESFGRGCNRRCEAHQKRPTHRSAE